MLRNLKIVQESNRKISKMKNTCVQYKSDRFKVLFLEPTARLYVHHKIFPFLRFQLSRLKNLAAYKTVK